MRYTPREDYDLGIRFDSHPGRVEASKRAVIETCEAIAKMGADSDHLQRETLQRSAPGKSRASGDKFAAARSSTAHSRANVELAAIAPRAFRARTARPVFGAIDVIITEMLLDNGS